MALHPDPRRLILHAPAKINLFLHIEGRRPDAYHTLTSLMAPLDLCDELHLTPTAQNNVSFSGPFADGIDPESNTLHQVLNFFPGETWDIQVHKVIPSGAGLGGGSSDAAALLKFLGDRRQIPAAKLHNMAAEIGADVPFFLDPQPRLVRGTGTDLGETLSLPPFHCVLAKPAASCPTGDIYQRLTLPAFSETPPLPQTADMKSWLAVLKSCRNDLFAPATALVPEIESLARFMGASALLARMTGSGSAVFALMEDQKRAEELAMGLRQRWPELWIHTGRVRG